MYSQILENVKTSEDANLLHSEIEKVKSALYGKGKKSLEDTLKNEVRKWSADILSDELNKTEDKKKYLSTLQDKLENMEELNISIAFEPKQKDINEITKQLSSKSNFLINIKYNPEIIAGATIDFRGEYRDYSLKKKVAQTLKNINNNGQI